MIIRGRHISIGIIIASQYLNSIPPIERNNCDVIITGKSNAQSVDILCDQFLPPCISKKDFLNYYNNATKNYGFLLINNNSTKTNDIDEI